MAKKRIIIPILTLMLIISIFQLQMRADESNSMEPAYVAHPCHEGSLHEHCNYYSYTQDCGCILDGIKCCCGKSMYLEVIYCKKHQY